MPPVDRHAVLVVEDEPVLRSWMVRGLSKIGGLDVVGTGSVRDARRSISEAPPDLVITDLDLPDGSGIEVVGVLDRVGLRIPIVFVSAFVGQFQGRLPKRADIDVFEKPISLDRLRRIIHERLKDGEISPSPFGVADYIQLAGMGRRSVVIEVRGSIAGRGEIIIRGGELWSAHDEQSTGEPAFRRLVFLKDAVVTCRPCDPSNELRVGGGHAGVARAEPRVRWLRVRGRGRRTVLAVRERRYARLGRRCYADRDRQRCIVDPSACQRCIVDPSACQRCIVDPSACQRCIVHHDPHKRSPA